MTLVRRKSGFLSNAPLEIRNDHEVVLTAMQHVPRGQVQVDIQTRDLGLWIFFRVQYVSTFHGFGFGFRFGF